MTSRNAAAQEQRRYSPINLEFQYCPAFWLLSAASPVSLVLAICGCVHPWLSLGGGAFCAAVGVLGFVGCSFDFFTRYFKLIDNVPIYNAALTFMHFCLSALCLLAFVASASAGGSSDVGGAAIAASVFAFIGTGLNVAILVLTYLTYPDWRRGEPDA